MQVDFKGPPKKSEQNGKLKVVVRCIIVNNWYLVANPVLMGEKKFPDYNLAATGRSYCCIQVDRKLFYGKLIRSAKKTATLQSRRAAVYHLQTAIAVSYIYNITTGVLWYNT